MIIIWVHGKRITAAIKKYGIENFSKEILNFFDTRLEMFEYEHLIVNEEILKDPQCYNLTIGGAGYLHIENLKDYISVFDKESNTWKRIKIDDYKLDKQKYDIQFSNKVCVLSTDNKSWVFIDRKEYQQNKEKYTTPSLNMVTVSADNGKTWKQISKEEFNNNKEKYITTTNNKIVVKDKLGKIYCVDKTDERYLSGDLVPIWTGKRHREESKEKIRNTMTPKDSKNPRVWVSKDGKYKYLRKELLEEYLNNGWIRGRIKK